MRAQPRQHLLDVWEAVINASVVDGEWRWGGRVGRNSVIDAEQLLCLLYPAAELRAFKLDQPDRTANDVLEALRQLGDGVDIPRRLVRLLIEYMQTYVDETGTPDFSGGSYFGPPDRPDDITAEQRALPVVESFTVSVALSLATLGFVGVFRPAVTRSDLLAEIDQLERLASVRLTAAMVGLLRSFTINVFPADSESGGVLIGALSQGGLPAYSVLGDLHDALEDIRAGLRDLTIGSGQVELDNPNLLFECGWSWSVIKDAPEVETWDQIGRQPKGVAPDRPSLYFTVRALAGILQLLSERTRILRLLNEEQQRLAAALQIRYDLTRQYWATAATFGSRRWPLEDMPWRTSDGEESDYFTLLATSLVSEDLIRGRATDADFARIFGVLNELASRGRVTRRAVEGDPAVHLHSPGVRLLLGGSASADEPVGTWTAPDFAPVLLERVVVVADLARSAELRRQLLDLADEIWVYLQQRRLPEGASAGLWDHPAAVFPLAGLPRYEQPSWHYTLRVVQALVALSRVLESQPLTSDPLVTHAWLVVSEAEQLLDQEVERGSAQAGKQIRAAMRSMRADLLRARELVAERPATASALANSVLLQLDQLQRARLDAGAF